MIGGCAIGGCGVENPEGPFNGAVGLVNGGGGLEDLDATPPLGGGGADAEVAGDGAGGHGGSTGEGGEDATGSGEGQDASTANASGGDSSQPPPADAAETTDGADGATGYQGGGDAAVGTDAGANADATGSAEASGADAAGGGDSQAGAGGGDGGSGAVELSLSGGHLTWLDWAINGPNAYTGLVTIGDAESIEWLIGGIEEGAGYTLTITATDTSGEPCTGTSPPFAVEAGQISSTTLTIVCDSPPSDIPDVTTGSVVVDASVVVSGP